MSNKSFKFVQKEKYNTGGSLLYISTSKYEGDWHSTLHTHYCSEVFYVLRGRGRFLVGEETFEVHESDMVIVNPNVEHTEVSLDLNPLEYIVLGIGGLAFGTEPGGAGSYSLVNCRGRQQEVLFYLRSMLGEVDRREPGYEAVCQNLLEVLLIQLMRHTEYSLVVTSMQRTSKECGAIKRYLDENYKYNITLDTLAALTHMNKYYLVHAFNRYTGMSPISYLIARRIDESKSLLETTNYSIAQISDIIGFSSQSYFSQLFKKNAGESPNEYRKRVRPSVPIRSEAGATKTEPPDERRPRTEPKK